MPGDMTCSQCFNYGCFCFNLCVNDYFILLTHLEASCAIKWHTNPSCNKRQAVVSPPPICLSTHVLLSDIFSTTQHTRHVISNKYHYFVWDKWKCSLTLGLSRIIRANNLLCSCTAASVNRQAANKGGALQSLK